MNQYTNYPPNFNFIYKPDPPTASNNIGIAGFVLATVSIFTSWIPVLGFIIWFLGYIFSFVGCFKEPRGFAVTGIIISFLNLLIFIFLFTQIANFFTELLYIFNG